MTPEEAWRKLTVPTQTEHQRVVNRRKLLRSWSVSFLGTSPNGWSFFIFLLTHSKYLNMNNCEKVNKKVTSVWPQH